MKILLVIFLGVLWQGNVYGADGVRLAFGALIQDPEFSKMTKKLEEINQELISMEQGFYTVSGHRGLKVIFWDHENSKDRKHWAYLERLNKNPTQYTVTLCFKENAEDRNCKYIAELAKKVGESLEGKPY